VVEGWKLPGAGVEEAFGWGRELGVSDGCAVASHIDGVHDRQSAAYAKDESEEYTDQCAGKEVHDELNGMRYKDAGRLQHTGATAGE
jgi:hypothetical protein